MSVVSEDNRRSFIQKLTDDLHIPKMSIQHILTKEFGVKCICSTWVPNFSLAEEMGHRCSVCSENLAQISQDPDFFSRVITF